MKYLGTISKHIGGRECWYLLQGMMRAFGNALVIDVINGKTLQYRGVK